MFRTKSRDLLRPQVLRVLDAKAPVACTVLLSHLAKHVQNGLVGLVTDRVNCNLKTSLVSSCNSIPHLRLGKHFQIRQSGSLRIIQIRCKEQRRSGAQRSVSKSLQTTDLQKAIT